MFKIQPKITQPILQVLVTPTLVRYASEEVHILWKGKRVFAISLDFENRLRWPKGVLRIPPEVLKAGKFKIKAYGLFRSTQKSITLPITVKFKNPEINITESPLAFDTSHPPMPQINISAPSYQPNVPIFKKEVQITEIKPPYIDYFKN